jgi:hypothetical protein
MTEGYATRDDALRALRAENANLRRVNAAQADRIAELQKDARALTAMLARVIQSEDGP